jgi:hypothetical protein
MKEITAHDVRNIKRIMHNTLVRVTRDISEERQFNTAVARLMELTNALIGFRPAAPEAWSVMREGVETLLSCLSPFAPHITEELWHMIGNDTFLSVEKWFEVDPESLVEDTVTVVLQINGKVREQFDVKGRPVEGRTQRGDPLETRDKEKDRGQRDRQGHPDPRQAGKYSGEGLMPSLLLISASGTAQRRLLEETVADFEKKGHVISGRQEGGEWSPLLSDNLSGGLFDEKRLIVVESASLLGPFRKTSMQWWKLIHPWSYF